MISNVKYWRANFFPIEDLDTRSNFCIKYFIQQPSKMTMEPPLNGTNNCIKLKKGRYSWIGDFLNCATMFLFFISIKLKVFRVTENETRKMVKKFRLY